MKWKKTRQAVVRTLALSVILAALTSMPPKVVASAKCRLSNEIAFSGPEIWQAIELMVELVGVRVLPGERMGVTPRGEEAFLSLPFALSSGCIDL